jgi:transcriptional antiterminator
MILFKQIELLKHLHQLIGSSNTGTPEIFAKQLGISSRRLHAIIDELKDLGAPIDYSRFMETYFYEEAFDMEITCKFHKLSDKDRQDISGGAYLFSHFSFTACFVQ